MQTVKKKNGRGWVGYVTLPAESAAFVTWIRPIIDAPDGPSIVQHEKDGTISWGSVCWAENECDVMLAALEGLWAQRGPRFRDGLALVLAEQIGWRAWWNRLLLLWILV
jgi:hypothetical protein